MNNDDNINRISIHNVPGLASIWCQRGQYICGKWCFI